MIDVSHDPDYEQYNPMRSLNWRWGRAMWLVGKGRQFRQDRDDELTGLAVGYLRDRVRCRTDRQFRNLSRRHPDLHAALRLHKNGGLDRWEVEARLLARQSSQEIGRLTDLPIATVDAFESLFFNVRDRFDARCFILKAAIGHIGQVGHIKDDRAVFLRSIGYFGGPIVLDTVLKHLGAIADTPGEQSGSSATEPDLTRRIRLLMAAMALEFDGRTALNLGSICLGSGASKPVRNGHVFAQEVAETLENVLQETASNSVQTKGAVPATDEYREIDEAA